MDDNQLRRALRSVGYRCFIVYKDVFLDTSIPMDAAARHLHVTEKTWSMGGCLMRVSHARRIVESGRVDDAMKLIAKSKIDPILTRIAEQWISGDRIKAFTV